MTGNIKLPEGVEMVMPGDNVDMECTLITPIAMDEKLRFAIREGGRTVGSGVVTKILEDTRSKRSNKRGLSKGALLSRNHKKFCVKRGRDARIFLQSASLTDLRRSACLLPHSGRQAPRPKKGALWGELSSV